MIITIDGRAGTGKTTVARLLAKKLGFLYVDTGAMYRIVAYLLLKKKIALTDSKKLENFLKDFAFEIVDKQGTPHYFTEGEEVTTAIRSQEVTSFVSEVAALPAVRQALAIIQRQMGEKGDVIFEGRDMGTVIFPHADLKIFLSASEEIAAKRRFLEIKEKETEEEILKKMKKRDALDSMRDIAPLKKAEDAYEIDTTHMSIEEVVEKIISLIP